MKNGNKLIDTENIFRATRQEMDVGELVKKGNRIK